MFKKFAQATIISAEIAERDAVGLVKASHRAVFDYEPKPGFLYVRSRMISSRCNDNHDEFPAEEIKAAWKTAIGKPAFVNHHNETHKRMRGVIIDAALHEDALPDGKPDIWIEALHEIDAKRFPKLAGAIMKGRVNRTSMGCDVGFSVCSACGNKASTPAEYCEHIPRMKGKILYRHTASGHREGHLIREICHKISFFENSFLVEDPADPTAAVLGVDDRGLKRTAATMVRERQQERSRSHGDDGPPPAEMEDWGGGGGGRNEFLIIKHRPDYFSLTNNVEDSHNDRHVSYHYALGDAVHELAHLKARREYDPRELRYAGKPDFKRTRDMTPELQVHYSQWFDKNAPNHNPHPVVSQHSRDMSDDELAEHWKTFHNAQQPLKGSPDKQRQTHEAWHGQMDWPNHGNRSSEIHLCQSTRRGETCNYKSPGGHTHAPSMGDLFGDSEALNSLFEEGEGPSKLSSRTSSLPKVAEYWVNCGRPGCGEHWGPDGAAGMLIRHHDPDDGETRYLLQKRAPWVDHGGTWGTPGGALHEDESPEEGAQREAEEEMGELPHDLRHHRTHTDDHGGWAYHTVVMDSPERFEPYGGGDDEHAGHGWFTTHEMKNLHLHPGFAQSLKTVTSMRKGAPFAGYDDFEDCEKKNADKDDPSAYCGEVKHRVEGSSLPSVVAYGETKAPADVDTLRAESCPVCGETDSFDGDRCQVCHFIQPPAMFTDPDTGVARQMDLKKDELDQQAQVGPDGMPVDGGPGEIDPNDPTGMNQPMTGTPGMAQDQIADLFCPACGFSADTQEPMTNNDPSMASEQQGLMEGDVCSNCGQATMLSPNDVGELGGEVPQEIADDADADGIPDDQEPDVDEDGVPDDQEPDEDADGRPDDSERDSDEDAVPDDADPDDENPEIPGESDEEPDEGPDAVEDEEEAQKGRKDNSRRASRRGPTRMRETMTKPKNAAATESSKIAALQKLLEKQDRTLRAQAAILEVAGQQLHYLATVAGVSKEFDAIRAQGAKKVADIMNPAQPIPDPPGGAPTESTPEAEAPETYDDPRNPGLTPGSTNGVPAQQTDSPLNPGVTLPTSPYTQLVDPTQPVAGTEEHVPLDQTKIETDVRVGDPMVGAGTPEGTAFPLTGPFAADGAASANTVTSPGYQNQGRTMASLRLAKLRKNAGLVPADKDEFLVATDIERTAALTDQMIEHEIATLDALTKAAAKTPGRRPQGGRLPKAASAQQRRVPSLAGAPEQGLAAVAATGFDDGDASDLFLTDSLVSD